MTTFKEIQGRNIRAVSSDPANPGEGEMWYNKTIGVLKGVSKIGAWSSGGNLSTGRYVAAALGTQTAAVVVGGSPFLNSVEEYNGIGFSVGTNYPIGISNSGRAGTQTAGLVAGGNAPPFTATANTYDGSSWTATGSLPTAADNIGSCGTGTQSNVIMALGRIPSTGNSGNNTTATYNGSTFSSGPNINTARLFAQSSAGTGTAGLIYGGFIDPTPNAMTNTEEYNGTAWTAASALNRASGLNTGWGTQTSAIAQVNTPGYKGAEQYDGTSWTNISDMTLADNGSNYSTAAGATADAGFITSRGPAFSATEEYNFSVNVITPAAWSSGGNLSLARYGSAGAGTSQNAALVAAGTQAPAYTNHNDTEEYNGSTWATGGTYPTSGGGQRGCGSLTAALGTTPTSTNTYDGSTWTNLGAPSNLNLSRSNTWLVGSSTAGLAWGGIIPGPGTRTNVTEEWNGSAWTTSPGTISDSVSGATGFGDQTAALRVAGDLGPANTSNVDSYNGTTWTASTSYPISIKDAFGTGTLTDGLVASGAGGPGGTDVVTTVVSGWDGSAWSTRPTMGTSRRDNTGGSTSGPANAAVQGGGNNPPTTSIANTEEYNIGTTALNIKTFTTS